jgi:uncharacterized protein
MRHPSRRPLRLDTSSARALALEAQGFGAVRYASDPPGAIEALGLVQIDAVARVQRSQYLVLFSRCGTIDPAGIDRLLDPDRRMFEQWLHAACLAPIADYSWLAPIIEERRVGPLRYGHRRTMGDDAERLMAEMRACLETRGPVLASQHEWNRKHQDGWWRRGIARAALDALLYLGEAAIVGRRRFEPVYDLVDRVIPAEHRAPAAQAVESRRWVARRSIECLGVGTVADIADYYRQPIALTRRAVHDLLLRGDVVELAVDGWKNSGYTLAKTLEAGLPDGSTADGCTLLSPFDNLIWTRERVRRLFTFDYANAMYRPAGHSARAAGYYVMPILDRGDLVGRVDARVERSSLTFVVERLTIEAPSRQTRASAARIGRAITELAAFTGCTSVRAVVVEPFRLAGALQKEWC